MHDAMIRVSDFTTIPGGRFRKSGDGSAEEFYEDYIVPLLDDSKVGIVTIDLSGTWGYPVSFTSQLGLYLKDHLGSYGAVRKKIAIMASDNPEVVSRFWEQAREDS